MIVEAELFEQGAVTTLHCSDTNTLTITVHLRGRTFKRSDLTLVELPAFIEYMECNDTFQLTDFFYVRITGKSKGIFLNDLRQNLKIMKEAAE